MIYHVVVLIMNTRALQKRIVVADNHDLDLSAYLQKAQPSPGKSLSAPIARKELSALQLMARALGGPLVIFDKLKRFFVTLSYYFRPGAQRKRLERLKIKGYIEKIPSWGQIWFGSFDMLRYFIEPAAESYLKSKGINFFFHQVLRVLNDPASMIDPVGIRVPRDTIICHVLEVVHANPVYDFQALEQFDDGLDQMQLQVEQMLQKSHKRYKSISAITEDPDYHQRRYTYLLEYRKDPLTRQMIRDTGDARKDRAFLLAELTYGTLPSVFRYFNRLPHKFSDLWRHYREDSVINEKYCDAHIVEKLNKYYS